MRGHVSIWRKGLEALSACVQAYGSFCNRWTLTPLYDGIDIHDWSDYTEKGVGFNIWKHLNMTLYSQINLTSHLK